MSAQKASKTAKPKKTVKVKSSKVSKISSKSKSVKKSIKSPVSKKSLKIKITKATTDLIKTNANSKKVPEIKIEIPLKPTIAKKDMKKVLSILSDSRIRQTLIDVGGENALAIIKNFYTDCSDEEISKRLKIKISDVRATLNKLHNKGLVNYIRAKDSETGWYSYSWSLNRERIAQWAIDLNNEVLPGNAGDTQEYYFCPACGEVSLTSFECAANGDFRCERCNRLLEFVDETRMTEIQEKRRLY